jgi:hypothetical protein
MHNRVIFDLRTRSSKTVRMYPVLDQSGMVVRLVDAADHVPPSGHTIGNSDHANIRAGDRWDGSRYIQPVNPEQVTAERERRLNGGMEWDFGAAGIKRIETDERSRQAIEKVGNRAMQAMIEEIPKGTLTWDDPGSEFAWITADNTPAYMDHFQMLDMAKAVGEFETRLKLRARKLKDQKPIPGDYADDKHWV